MGGHIGDMVSQHWNTPARIVEAVAQAFGGQIDLDPCDNAFSMTFPRVSYKLPGNNGLEKSWVIAPDGSPIRNVFCNPPYGRDTESGTSIADWVERAATYTEAVHSPEVILLIPSSTETGFWHEYIWNVADAICFLKGRLAFPLEGKKKASATKGSAVIYYGEHVQRFVDAFNGLGHTVRQDDDQI
jgi:phage N-6-adenine-methyltransferase